MKITTIRDWKPPANLQELQSFLGFVNYVRRFIPNMARATGTLTDLLPKGTSFEWGERQQAAFDELINFLMSPSVLRIADPSRPFEVLMGASDFAIGAVLLQDFGDGLQPIAYESRKLRAAERNYPVHDKEMLAIVHAFKVWRCYLTGADVTIRTYNTSVRSQTSTHDRFAGWISSRATSTTPLQTAKIFISTIVRLHGLPSAIISDRDPKFTSKFWQETWEQYGTRLQFSSAYHPQTDGQTERTNQTMEQLIRTSCPDPAQWEEFLPMLEFSYNNAPSATRNHSPFFLNYGMDPTVPTTTNIDNPVPQS
ncbi:hypothetical protein CLOM_g8257 [Closterium sp. NIES-68]|nr:hypothetical protein CLOM_g8257 [Closterium sp. NIES-68]